MAGNRASVLGNVQDERGLLGEDFEAKFLCGFLWFFCGFVSELFVRLNLSISITKHNQTEIHIKSTRNSHRYFETSRRNPHINSYTNPQENSHTNPHTNSQTKSQKKSQKNPQGNPHTNSQKNTDKSTNKNTTNHKPNSNTTKMQTHTTN